MYKSYWLKQEEKFIKAISDVKIPNCKLEKVDYVIIKDESDLNSINDKGGCYWIWTNEPVYHRLHKHKLPKRFDEGEVIYNGIAKDNVRKRIERHLLGSSKADWSGISMDIFLEPESQSHRKKALSKKGKVPYILDNKTVLHGNKNKGIKKGDIIQIFSPIKTEQRFLKINLSSEEKLFITRTKYSTYFFRNGINITEDKHKNFEFRVYYIICSNSMFLEYIEKEWRNMNKCLPRLCSYSSGR